MKRYYFIVNFYNDKHEKYCTYKYFPKQNFFKFYNSAEKCLLKNYRSFNCHTLPFKYRDNCYISFNVKSIGYYIEFEIKEENDNFIIMHFGSPGAGYHVDLIKR